MEWMVTENQLGQEQTLILNQCVKSSNSCNWIQGFAGSGKTVLLIHAMELLRVAHPDQTLCFVTFTHALKDLVSTGLSDKSKHLPILTVDQFIRNRKHFDIVFADEIQDLPNHKLAQLKAHSGRLVVAGDIDQSIYDAGVSAEEIEYLLTPVSHKLTVLYRLTHTLQALARALLPSTSIAGAKINRQQDTDIVLARASNAREEVGWVIDRAISMARPGKPALIILPKQEDIFEFIEVMAGVKGVAAPEKSYREVSYGKNRSSKSRKLDWDAINQELTESGLPIRYLGSGSGELLESDQMPLIYIMTYHSAKGLDFPHVFLPRMNSSVQLWRDDLGLERRLFFVGVTRSRENLFITYSSKEPHYLVSELPQKFMKLVDCKKIHEAVKNNDEEHLF